MREACEERMCSEGVCEEREEYAGKGEEREVCEERKGA